MPSDECPANTFDEARRIHMEDFASATPEQKLEWLGHMLEIMRLAHEARAEASKMSQ